MSNSLPSRLVVSSSFLALSFTSVFASGPFIPTRWLESGGQAVVRSPEFYWELEMKRLAKEVTVAEKRRPVSKGEFEEVLIEEFIKQVSDADLADFEDAIKTSRIQPGDAEAATAQHKAARDVTSAANEATTEVLATELDSEFADYHKGAFAFRKGEAHWHAAKAAWEGLLKRPKEQRHYRSTWAAFMLGKLMVFKKDPGAPTQFASVRKLAGEGFADTLGLAADSYGWEAKSMLDQGKVAEAARLYLKQLSLGDKSAIVSLKACVPDRVSVEGMMNFDETAGGLYELSAINEWRKGKQAAIEAAAGDPLLRRITTAHVLATETVNLDYIQDKSSRSTEWLAAVQKAGVKEVVDADRLGWVAYAAGRFDEASAWLERSDGMGATAQWLKSKLLRRGGKVKEALEPMAQAFEKLKADALLATQQPLMGAEGMSYSPIASAGGDLGALYLSTEDFVKAFDAFLTSGHWDDAAFIAERVLTADELKGYVDTHPQAAPKAEDSDYHDLNHLLARRLVREDRYAEARKYFPDELKPKLDQYVKALDLAADAKTPKASKARAWWDAAVLARFSGMELMGTEVEPDGAVFGGSFESPRVADERELGTFEKVSYLQDGTEKKEKLPILVTVSAEERKRLAKYRPTPNKRFHYRYVAAAIGWKAAALLPDQSPELADVLNSCGSWIKGDSDSADKFFQAIERRASKTDVGKAAGKAHWFVESYGPWSIAPAQE